MSLNIKIESHWLVNKFKDWISILNNNPLNLLLIFKTYPFKKKTLSDKLINFNKLSADSKNKIKMLKDLFNNIESDSNLKLKELVISNSHFLDYQERIKISRED